MCGESSGGMLMAVKKGGLFGSFLGGGQAVINSAQCAGDMLESTMGPAALS